MSRLNNQGCLRRSLFTFQAAYTRLPPNSSFQIFCKLNLWNQYFAAVSIPLRKVYYLCRDRAARWCVYLCLCLLFCSRSAWSLYSPCGPFGRTSTLTHTSGDVVSLSNGGSVCLFASNPISFSSLTSARANSGAAPTFVDWIVTPVSAPTIGSPYFPDAFSERMLAGGCTIAPLARNASAMSSPNNCASASLPWYQKLTPTSPLNLAKSSPSCFFCWGVNWRKATAASTLTRASLSSSAFIFSCCVSLSSFFDRSSAALALSLYSALSFPFASRTLVSSLPARMLTRSSPPMPARTKTTPNISTNSHLMGGFSGNDMNPLVRAVCHSFLSWRYPRQINMTSNAHPTIRHVVQKWSRPWRASICLLRKPMSAFSADSSIESFRYDEDRTSRIQLIAIILIGVAGLLFVLVMWLQDIR
jgi:hypothetical protein